MNGSKDEPQGRPEERPSLREVSPEQLKVILGEHRKCVESDGKEGRRADLSRANLSVANLSGAILLRADFQGANLSGANLPEANLSGADLLEANLFRANLSGADLFKANLSRASLSGANLSGADLTKANFSEADLSRADLSSADLSGADLSGADLSDTIISGARLDRASFLRADLTNAVLVGGESEKEQETDQDVEGDKEATKSDVPAGKITLPDPTVAGTNFGMAILIGAKLPASLNEFRDSLKNVEETSKNARTIYFSVIALCAFVLLTVATTTDAQLILDNIRLKLPIINAEVSVVLFYVSAPIIGLLVFCYLHMYLAHLWELAAGLPAIFPDGLPLRRKLYPWMLNLVIEEWQRKGWTGWSLFKSLRAWIAIALGWALVPLTIGGVAYRLLVRHDAQASYFFLGLLAVSVLLSSALYQYARAIVRNTGVRWRWLLPVFITALALGAGLYGTDQGLKGNLRWTTPKILLRNADLTGLVIRGTDLGSADLSFAKLVKADLRGTNLAKTNLHGADLTNADLYKADLADSDLREATLVHAKLLTADLFRANLIGADLSGADLRGAGLFGANLSMAKLIRASFFKANLIRADLSRADLSDADLSDADLNGAFLFGANLNGADLSGADLNEADLRDREEGGKTTGLTASQVKQAENWKLAFYPDDFLGELGLPADHNETLPGKLAENAKIREVGDAE